VSNEIPKVPVQPARRSFLERASIVWMVPVAALLIALGVAWNTWAERGPLIEIAFEDAAGIAANETELRYRNVAVGIVERVRFTPTLERVLVSVRLDKDVAPFVDDDAQFWIVQPEVTASGVTGLETVLSGIYIEGTWDASPDGMQYAFEAVQTAPLLTSARKGLEIELRSSRDSGMTEHTPILYKGIEVGRIGPARISQDGQWVFAPAVIFEPHDRLVTTATRFWDTSGFTFTLGPNGAELDFSSVATLLAGGITFDTLVSGGQRLQTGMVFEVFPDESSARTSVFEDSDGTTVTLSMVFDENVSGLAAEAPVEWRGVRIGEVVNVNGLVDPDRFRDARVHLVATVELRPSRFGLGGDLSEDDALAFLAERVAEGLRARLVSASILTGGLKVELLEVDDAPTAVLDTKAEPFPVFPVTASEIADVTATAEGVFERINALPIEELLQSAIGFLDNATAFVTSEDIRETPGELRGLLSEVRGVVGSDDIQALPGELSAVMADVQSATGDLREILAAVREADTVARVLAAVDQAGAAAKTADAALAALPDLSERVAALVDKANALPLEDLMSEITGLAEDARRIVAGEALQALPERVATAVAALEEVLGGLTEADTAGQLTRALAAAETAAGAVEEAVAGVPGVVARIDTIAKNAEDVKLDQLASELAGVLATARRLFGDTSDAELPAALAGALNEAEAALAELRAGGLIDSANETLASTRRAAAAVAEAADDLPALVERVNRTLQQAESTLSGYDKDSTFTREMQTALRDIQRASDAVADLARTIERRPNSIILGR
jgi:paraquat-inducible protein B